MPLLPSLNGYGQLEGTLSQGTKGQEGYVPQNVTVDTVAESFIRDGLSKVMKITNICDSEHLSDCGLPDKIIPIDGSSAINLNTIKVLSSFNSEIINATKYYANSTIPYEQIDTKAAAFETVNGESVLVYYNPNCEPDLNELSVNTGSQLNSYFVQTKLCANFVYDLNGKKGPNTVGKDIGVISALYSTSPVVVAPDPYSSDSSDSISYTDSFQKCKELGDEWKVPNIDELSAIFFNRRLFVFSGGHYWSSNKFSGTNLAWLQSRSSGSRYTYNIDSAFRLRCVKR